MKNWKTTLFGIITACGPALNQTSDPKLQVAGQLLSVLGPILLGVFAKDSNVTGGTTAQ